MRGADGKELGAHIMNLTRFAYLDDMTLGWLEIAGLRLATLERPWIPVPEHRGGKVRESCIPDGDYEVVFHTGPHFKQVWALVNPCLDVHHMPSGPGRSGILIHAANTVHEIVGCIAVGMEHGDLAGTRAVLRSKEAIEALRTRLKPPLPQLRIRAIRGTAELAARLEG